MMCPFMVSSVEMIYIVESGTSGEPLIYLISPLLFKLIYEIIKITQEMILYGLSDLWRYVRDPTY